MSGRYTPEPWTAGVTPYDSNKIFGVDRTSGMKQTVATVYGYTREEVEANKRRIVACVNFCKSITTEDLLTCEINGLRLRAEEDMDEVTAEDRLETALKRLSDLETMHTVAQREAKRYRELARRLAEGLEPLGRLWPADEFPGGKGKTAGDYRIKCEDIRRARTLRAEAREAGVLK